MPQIGFPMIATQFWAFSFILGNSGKFCCENAKNIAYMLKKLFFKISDKNYDNDFESGQKIIESSFLRKR